MVVALPDRERKQVEQLEVRSDPVEALGEAWDGLGVKIKVDPSKDGIRYACALSRFDHRQVLEVVNELLAV